jgi:uncharacterized membrane protein YphA (DoxX/SURF4 family)
MNFNKILLYILTLFLAGMMIYGSVSKFQKPFSTPNQVTEKATQYIDQDKPNIATLVLYIGSMRQTGYAWLLVGLAELLFGILLIIPKTRLIGSLGLLPLTLNILLFHIFLEPEEVKGLAMSIGLMVANAIIVFQLAKQKNFLLVN